MMIHLRDAGIALTLTLLVAFTAGIAGAAAQEGRPTNYRIWGGDLSGDGKAEVITWDNVTKRMAILDYSSGSPRELSAQVLEGHPTHVTVADVDGDDIDELIIGEGLEGYNRPDGSQTDLRLLIYEPLESGSWSPQEVFGIPSERPAVMSLEVDNMDGDAEPEILVSYMISKYEAEIAIVDRVGESWEVEKLDQIRMGMHVAAGDVLGNGKESVVVGRAYGDPIEGADTITLGDAFVLGQNGERLPLPAFRGVSVVAVGDVDDDDQTDILIGDGWHRDYGKVARSRLAQIEREDGEWKYRLIEDIPGGIRVERISMVDVDANGTDDVITWTARRGMFEGYLRSYRHTPSGWEGTMLADSVQGYAVGDFTGDSSVEVALAGAEPRVRSLDDVEWTRDLAEALVTVKVDPASLIGKQAPEIGAEEWIGGEETSLEELRGKVVLIDFWATWCGPCIDAFPTLERWLAEYGPDGFEIIGMTNHSSQTSADVRAMLSERPLPWVVPIDPSNRTHLAYGTGNLPHQVLIDRNGVVHAFYTGAGETLEQVEADIRKLLAER